MSKGINSLKKAVKLCMDCVRDMDLEKEIGKDTPMITDVCQSCGKITTVCIYSDLFQPEIINNLSYFDGIYTLGTIDLIQTRVYTWSCPSCGAETIEDISKDRESIVSCPECRSYFNIGDVYYSD